MKFKIENREIQCMDDQINIVGDNADYVAEFEFDEEWEGKVKTARFMKDAFFVDVVLENKTCIIPIQLLKRGYMSVGVYGAEMTTTRTDVHVKESVKEQDGIQAPPEESIYEQLLKKIDDIAAGGIDEEALKKAIQDYLAEHPIEVTGYATESYVDNSIEALNIRQYVKKSDIGEELAAYVTEHREELKGDKGDKGENGLPGKDGKDGEKGADGAPGKDGKDGLPGTDGEKGDPGEKGADGTNGKDGKDGYTPVKGKDYFDGEKGDTGEKGADGTPGAKGEPGEKGEPGAKGEPGQDGEDGTTPTRGVDYWTEADKNEIKAYVEEAILGGEW